MPNYEQGLRNSSPSQKQNKNSFNKYDSHGKRDLKTESNKFGPLNDLQVGFGHQKWAPGYKNEGQAYEQMAELCSRLRKENAELKSTISHLENKIKILEEGNNEVETSKYCDRIKFLQEQFTQYRRNLYETSKKQNKQLYKTVQYLIICYQEYITGRNYKFGDFVAKVKDKGMGKVLSDHSFVNQMISMYEGKGIEFCFEGEFGIGKQLDQRQSKVLRSKIKELSSFIQTLIKLYRDQLIKIKEEARGQSEQVVSQIKNCILRNMDKIAECRPKMGKVSLNSSSSQSQTTNKSKEKNIRKRQEESQQLFKKKLSLGNSIDICNPRRPPLPTGQSSKTKANGFTIQLNNGIMNPTPKNRKSVQGIGGSMSKSKRKRN